MSKAFQWIISVSLVVILAATLFSTVMPFFFARTGGYGMMGPHGMGGFGMPMFGFGMVAMLGWPLLALGLIGLGVLWLFRQPGASATSPAPTARVCSHCGQPLQPEWIACPHCGEKV
jgi:hypothetical protein